MTSFPRGTCDKMWQFQSGNCFKAPARLKRDGVAFMLAITSIHFISSITNNYSHTITADNNHQWALVSPFHLSLSLTTFPVCFHLSHAHGTVVISQLRHDTFCVLCALFAINKLSLSLPSDHRSKEGLSMQWRHAHLYAVFGQSSFGGEVFAGVHVRIVRHVERFLHLVNLKGRENRPETRRRLY